MTFSKAMQRLGHAIPAVVVSAGKMEKTVTARVGVQQWNDHIKKNFNRRKNVLVHDPADSLRTGDVITVASGWAVSKSVHHVVHKIIAPFGSPIEERPPVPSLKEMILAKQQRKALKLELRKRRRLGLPIDDLKKVDEKKSDAPTQVDTGSRWPEYIPEKTTRDVVIDNSWPEYIPEKTTKDVATDNRWPEHDSDNTLHDVATDTELADSLNKLNVSSHKAKK